MLATLKPEHPELVPLLNLDRAWAAYALCDLDPTYLPHCTFVGAIAGWSLQTVLMVFEPGAFTSLSSYGDSQLLPPLLAHWRAQQSQVQATALARDHDIAAYQSVFVTTAPVHLDRMVVTSDRFQPRACPTGYTMRRLTEADLPALRALYAAWPATVFTPYMLTGGVYAGAFQAGELVAAAGTHGLHTPERIAVIGNVYTDPAHRGRGLAAACTGSVTEHLFALGAADVALNVKVDNAPAIAAYQRLGFHRAMSFFEMRCTLA